MLCVVRTLSLSLFNFYLCPHSLNPFTIVCVCVLFAAHARFVAFSLFFTMQHFDCINITCAIKCSCHSLVFALMLSKPRIKREFCRDTNRYYIIFITINLHIRTELWLYTFMLKTHSHISSVLLIIYNRSFCAERISALVVVVIVVAVNIVVVH